MTMFQVKLVEGTQLGQALNQGVKCRSGAALRAGALQAADYPLQVGPPSSNPFDRSLLGVQHGDFAQIERRQVSVPGIQFILPMVELDNMGASAQDGVLLPLGFTTDINKKGQPPAVDNLTHVFNKFIAVASFVARAQHAHQALLPLHIPVAFPIGNGTQQVVGDPPAAQRLGKKISQYRFAAVRRASDQYRRVSVSLDDLHLGADW
jgi:hypothetical protein